MSADAHRARWLVPVLVLLVVLSAGGALALWGTRRARESRDARERVMDVQQGPRVVVAPAQVTAGEKAVTLPGDVRGFNQATLYAKVSGYLKEIRVERGERVKKDQVLGVLESPETDQQVVAAQADLMAKQQAASRARALAPKGIVSQQELENAVAALDVAKANLRRAKALEEYEVVRAPFDGTIIGRYVDVGALLPAATGSTTAAQPLVDIADTERVRVMVYVGQDLAPFLHEGDPATVVADERPELRIDGSVTKLSRGLDPRSRAMLCEIWLDNASHQLYPGTFVHVTLRVKVPPLPTVPSEALISRGSGMFVAVVRDQKLAFRPIEPGLDDGKTVQIKRGLEGGELVALNVPSELSDGSPVRPISASERGAPSRQGATR